MPLVFILLILITFSGGDLAAQSSAEWTPAPALRRAVAPVCQEWVRDHLRAPSHATFRQAPSVVAAENYHLHVSGDAEAMNGFGGFNRVTFMCDFEPDPRDHTYVLVDFFASRTR